jgi:phage FluMu protein Com
MLRKICPKCKTINQFYYDDDCISKAEACLVCGYHHELSKNKDTALVAAQRSSKYG